jgi:predicted MFS family arabinose efflux permease
VSVSVAEADVVSARRADVLALTLMSFLALNAVSLSLVPIVAPQLHDTFGLSASRIGLLTSAFALAVSLAAVPMGVAAGRRGGRTVAVATVCFAAGSIMFAAGSSFGWFLAGRFLQGIGAGAAIPVGTTLIAHVVVPGRRPRAFGVFGAGMGVGIIGSLLILPTIQRSGGYRVVFLVAAGLALLVGAAAMSQRVFRAVPRRAGEGSSLPTAGRALSAAATNPRMLLIALMNLAGLAVVVGLLTWTPGLLQDHHGSSLAIAAYLTAGIGLAQLVGNPLGAVALTRWGKGPVLFATLALTTAATALVPVTPGLGATFVCVTVDGFFAAAMLPALLGAIPEVVHPDQVGAATGLMSLLNFAGSMLAPWLFGALLDAHGTAPGQSGYLDGYLMLAGLSVLGTAAAAAFWAVRRRTSEPGRRP